MEKAILLIGIFLCYVSCRESNEKLTERGIAQIQNSQYTEAVNTFSEIIKRNDKLQIPYYNRGLCYLELNDLNQALTDFNTVISLHRIDTTSKNEPKTLLKDEEVRAQVPINDAMFERAQILYKLDSLERSQKDFNLLISSNYEKSTCFLWLGLIWVKYGNENKACEMFNQSKYYASNENELKEAERFISDNCN